MSNNYQHINYAYYKSTIHPNLYLRQNGFNFEYIKDGQWQPYPRGMEIMVGIDCYFDVISEQEIISYLQSLKNI